MRFWIVIDKMDDLFSHIIVTSDETWLSHYTLKTIDLIKISLHDAKKAVFRHDNARIPTAATTKEKLTIFVKNFLIAHFTVPTLHLATISCCYSSNRGFLDKASKTARPSQNRR